MVVASSAGASQDVCLPHWLDHKWKSGAGGTRGLAPAESVRGRPLVRCRTLTNAAETDACPHSHSCATGVLGAVVNKLSAWQIGGRRFEPRSGIQVSKRKKNSLLIGK